MKTLENFFAEKSALLMLADGKHFWVSVLNPENTSITAEIVFNTSMTGYQEILTDPSYKNQFVLLTYPHIGNIGVNDDDIESDKIQVSGLIFQNLSLMQSSYRAKDNLHLYAKKQNIPLIYNLDTRELTKHLVAHGSQTATLISDRKFLQKTDFLATAQTLSQKQTIKNLNLTNQVSCKKNYLWQEEMRYENFNHKFHNQIINKTVLVYDLGVKFNILRSIKTYGLNLHVISSSANLLDAVDKLKPDAVVLSNGPGDPAACIDIINNTKELLKSNIPILGICLGHQILALAAGAKTEKMKFGHHGANHPVQNTQTKEIFITSQNHGFVVSEDELPHNIKITHRSLFDNTIQGIKLANSKAIGFQGHPEASPGPLDFQKFFGDFLKTI